MLKKLEIYYVLVTLPFLLLLVGSAIFSDAIVGTIVRNPHPQINYAIFVIILIGGILISLSARRLVGEAKTLKQYSSAIRDNTDWVTLQQMANTFTGDISYLLQMVAASGGRSISHQEQAAIEHEQTSARNHMTRRNALPQYLTGLLVGMGLLGTFIGLLATLADISALISSFADLDMSTASPMLVFRNMIERMKAPMQSMGIAFSASMFGLLGSIILGLMMVGIRRLQGDIFSVLGSEVARHIENALAHEGGNASASGGAYTGDESKVLLRIEERLAEAARSQQRMLASEIEDFQLQRALMLQALTEQTESNNNFRSELQQLSRQFGTVINLMQKGIGDTSAQISELTVHLAAEAKESKQLVQVVEKGNGETLAQIAELTALLAADAKESNKLLTQQVDEQKRLRDTLEAYKIEERLIEASRTQQRLLTSELDNFQAQRADMLRALTDQAETGNSFRTELQQLGRQLGTMFSSMEKGNDELCTQITELMVHRAADAKESHKLLSMQVNEQKRLRDSLDLRVASNNP